MDFPAVSVVEPGPARNNAAVPEAVDVVGTPTSLAEVAAAVAVLGLTRMRKETR